MIATRFFQPILASQPSAGSFRTMTIMIAALVAGFHCPIAVRSDDFPENLDRWIVTEPPEPGSERWWVAQGNAEYEWVVSLRGGRPVVDRRNAWDEHADPLPFPISPGRVDRGLSGRRYAIRVDDGWLVAYNGGEFGAGLWWFSPDGTDRSKLAEIWINGFFRTDSGILAIVEKPHAGNDTGQVLRCSHDPGGRWRTEPLVELGQAAKVAALDADGTLFVATDDRLLRVDPVTKEVETLSVDLFWQGLYPNSMVISPSGTLHVGMRHGVARFTPNGEGELMLSWLLPNQSFVDMKPTEGFK